MLVLGVEHIGNHSQSYRATSRAETTKETCEQNLPPGVAGTGEDLPGIDGTEGKLHNELAPILLGPWRPELAAETVEDQEPGHPRSGVREVVVAEVVLDVEAAYRIRVDGRVVICYLLASLELDSRWKGGLTHTRLAQGHDGQDPPFLLGGEHICRMFNGVGLVQDQRGILVRHKRGLAVCGNQGDSLRGLFPGSRGITRLTVGP